MSHFYGWLDVDGKKAITRRGRKSSGMSGKIINGDKEIIIKLKYDIANDKNYAIVLNNGVEVCKIME